MTAAAADYDAELGVWTLHFDIPRSEVVYFRLVVESWEDLAVTRTVDRIYTAAAPPAREPRSLVVALAVPGLVDDCVRGLQLLCDEIGGLQVTTTPPMRERLRADLLDHGVRPETLRG